MRVIIGATSRGRKVAAASRCQACGRRQEPKGQKLDDKSVVYVIWHKVRRIQ